MNKYNDEKFLIIPGTVRSANDSERHYISSKKIMDLYGLDPRDCLDLKNREYLLYKLDGIVFTPKENGDYSLPKEIRLQIDKKEHIVKKNTKKEIKSDFNSLSLFNRIIIAFKGMK